LVWHLFLPKLASFDQAICYLKERGEGATFDNPMSHLLNNTPPPKKREKERKERNHHLLD